MKIWRRSFDVVPPLLEEKDPHNPAREAKYKGVDPAALPLGESLRLTIDRVLPFWQDQVAPALLDGKTVIIAAHGNSLRALVKYLDGINDRDIVNLEIPTGIPQVYELDDQLRPLTHYYLE